MSHPTIKLKRKEERRLLSGHCWVFSNEISEISGNPEPGIVVEVRKHDGSLLGFGLFNPASLIAVRIFSSSEPAIDKEFFRDKIRAAASLREKLYPGWDSYRLVHGESDGLPGLIIDKYADCFSLQTLSLGMDKLKNSICDALEEEYSPRCIVERNESPLRRLEGLNQESGLIRGELDGPVAIHELDLKFEVDLEGGQKTGFYFDQRENRMACRRLAPGARVLDAYCNVGGFGLHMAKAGAKSVLGLDSSETAIASAARNAELNGLEKICSFSEARLPEALNRLRREKEEFEVIILDPPSLTRTKKAVPAARRSYVDMNRKAMSLLVEGGFLATASCSHHLTDETFKGCLEEAASGARRHLKILDWRTQAPDHPVLPAMPETRYLKFALLQVL
jgi:23S rRNA (cytosine1962-C5)-methyltransferase